MSQREFDQYSESYSDLLKDPIRDRFAGSSPEYFHSRKAQLVLEYFRRRQLVPSKMKYLDVGCGKGDLLRILQPSFSYVAGCDPSTGMIAGADDLNIRLQSDENKLPFDDDCFDFVTASGVFHHVAPGKRGTLIREVRRVMKPGAVFAIIEHNPMNPVTQLIVSRTPVDAGAILLPASEARKLIRSAELKLDDQRYFLYLPIAFYEHGGRFVEKLMSKIPLGGQYAAFGRKAAMTVAHQH